MGITKHTTRACGIMVLPALLGWQTDPRRQPAWLDPCWWRSPVKRFRFRMTSIWPQRTNMSLSRSSRSSTKELRDRRVRRRWRHCNPIASIITLPWWSSSLKPHILVQSPCVDLSAEQLDACLLTCVNLSLPFKAWNMPFVDVSGCAMRPARRDAYI